MLLLGQVHSLLRLGLYRLVLLRKWANAWSHTGFPIFRAVEEGGGFNPEDRLGPLLEFMFQLERCGATDLYWSKLTFEGVK